MRSIQMKGSGNVQAIAAAVLLLSVAAAALFSGGAAQAQEKESPYRFSSVKEWEGTFSIQANVTCARVAYCLLAQEIAPKRPGSARPWA